MKLKDECDMIVINPKAAKDINLSLSAKGLYFTLKDKLLSAHIMLFDESLQGHKVPKTIGELIEWIDENQPEKKNYKLCIARTHVDWQLIRPFHLWRGVKLIDALVELACKIAEEEK